MKNGKVLRPLGETIAKSSRSSRSSKSSISKLSSLMRTMSPAVWLNAEPEPTAEDVTGAWLTTDACWGWKATCLLLKPEVTNLTSSSSKQRTSQYAHSGKSKVYNFTNINQFAIGVYDTDWTSSNNFFGVLISHRGRSFYDSISITVGC